MAGEQKESVTADIRMVDLLNKDRAESIESQNIEEFIELQSAQRRAQAEAEAQAKERQKLLADKDLFEHYQANFCQEAQDLNETVSPVEGLLTPAELKVANSCLQRLDEDRFALIAKPEVKIEDAKFSPDLGGVVASYAALVAHLTILDQRFSLQALQSLMAEFDELVSHSERKNHNSVLTYINAHLALKAFMMKPEFCELWQLLEVLKKQAMLYNEISEKWGTSEVEKFKKKNNITDIKSLTGGLKDSYDKLTTSLSKVRKAACLKGEKAPFGIDTDKDFKNFFGKALLLVIDDSQSDSHRPPILPNFPILALAKKASKFIQTVNGTVERKVTEIRKTVSEVAEEAQDIVKQIKESQKALDMLPKAGLTVREQKTQEQHITGTRVNVVRLKQLHDFQVELLKIHNDKLYDADSSFESTCFNLENDLNITKQSLLTATPQQAIDYLVQLGDIQVKLRQAIAEYEHNAQSARAQVNRLLEIVKAPAFAEFSHDSERRTVLSFVNQVLSKPPSLARNQQRISAQLNQMIEVGFSKYALASYDEDTYHYQAEQQGKAIDAYVAKIKAARGQAYHLPYEQYMALLNDKIQLKQLFTPTAAVIERLTETIAKLSQDLTVIETYYPDQMTLIEQLTAQLERLTMVKGDLVKQCDAGMSAYHVANKVEKELASFYLNDLELRFKELKLEALLAEAQAAASWQYLNRDEQKANAFSYYQTQAKSHLTEIDTALQCIDQLANDPRGQDLRQRLSQAKSQLTQIVEGSVFNIPDAPVDQSFHFGTLAERDQALIRFKHTLQQKPQGLDLVKHARAFYQEDARFLQETLALLKQEYRGWFNKLTIPELKQECSLAADQLVIFSDNLTSRVQQDIVGADNSELSAIRLERWLRLLELAWQDGHIDLAWHLYLGIISVKTLASLLIHLPSESMDRLTLVESELLKYLDVHYKQQRAREQPQMIPLLAPLLKTADQYQSAKHQRVNHDTELDREVDGLFRDLLSAQSIDTQPRIDNPQLQRELWPQRLLIKAEDQALLTEIGWALAQNAETVASAIDALVKARFGAIDASVLARLTTEVDAKALSAELKPLAKVSNQISMAVVVSLLQVPQDGKRNEVVEQWLTVLDSLAGRHNDHAVDAILNAFQHQSLHHLFKAGIIPARYQERLAVMKQAYDQRCQSSAPFDGCPAARQLSMDLARLEGKLSLDKGQLRLCQERQQQLQQALATASWQPDNIFLQQAALALSHSVAKLQHNRQDLDRLQLHLFDRVKAKQAELAQQAQEQQELDAIENFLSVQQRSLQQWPDALAPSLLMPFVDNLAEKQQELGRRRADLASRSQYSQQSLLQIMAMESELSANADKCRELDSKIAACQELGQRLQSPTALTTTTLLTELTDIFRSQEKELSEAIAANHRHVQRLLAKIRVDQRVYQAVVPTALSTTFAKIDQDFAPNVDKALIQQAKNWVKVHQAARPTTETIWQKPSRFYHDGLLQSYRVAAEMPEQQYLAQKALIKNPVLYELITKHQWLLNADAKASDYIALNQCLQQKLPIDVLKHRLAKVLIDSDRITDQQWQAIHQANKQAFYHDALENPVLKDLVKGQLLKSGAFLRHFSKRYGTEGKIQALNQAIDQPLSEAQYKALLANVGIELDAQQMQQVLAKNAELHQRRRLFARQAEQLLIDSTPAATSAPVPAQEQALKPMPATETLSQDSARTSRLSRWANYAKEHPIQSVAAAAAACVLFKPAILVACGAAVVEVMRPAAPEPPRPNESGMDMLP